MNSLQLEEINPAIKGLVVLLSVIFLSLFLTVWTPLLFFIITVLATFAFGKVSFKKWLLVLLPFLLVAFGYFWTFIVFGDEEFKTGSKVIAHVWFITVTETTLQNGLSLALRVLGFASLSLLFIFTTDKTELMLSLMQQCKLPPKFAYGILAGYRFLPQMKDEFQTIQNAHRIRGIKRATTLKDRIHQLKRYIIPLLASAIRKAERTALAMESKGFTGAKGRVFYKTTSIKKKDAIFLLSTFLVMAICYYAPKLFQFTF